MVSGIEYATLMTAGDPVSPETRISGNHSNLRMWLMLLLISGGALVGTTLLGKKAKKPNKTKKERCKASLFFGRSEATRTPGLLVPNQARYQLRYTPIKLY